MTRGGIAVLSTVCMDCPVVCNGASFQAIRAAVMLAAGKSRRNPEPRRAAHE